MNDKISTLLAKLNTDLLIDGEWVPGSTGETLEVLNPATNEVITSVASATEEDAHRAFAAACRAQESWARTPARERSEILRRAFDLVMERAEDFAILMTLEMGKPLAEAYGEVTYGGEFLRWFSEEAVRHYGISGTTPEGSLHMQTVRHPVGPCFLVTPWNFPLAMATRKIAPALAAGCVMVLKPAKQTPLTSLYLAQTLIDAGLPQGVLNVVCGRSAAAISAPIMADPRLRKISFTGSTEVGKSLLKSAADNVLRTSMELGGNAPFLVFEDADIDEAVQGAMAAKLRNIGEACTAANRFLVQESIAAEFTEKFAAAMEDLVLGNGLEEGVTCGPLIDAHAVANMVALVEDAVVHGATAVTGGTRGEGTGNFFAPTVLKNVPPQARVFREEIFGPLAPITTFRTEQEAIALANDTEFGLASYLFTPDHSRIQRVSSQLEFGMVGINTGVISNAAAPFGGVKQSGMGREGGVDGLDDYTRLQYLGIKDPYS
ncbi:Succinate-semialdehyde dehydrogenase [NADP(+)] GabD [Corynebacterium occultum]|uniref:Succinate-semialdehyde dehydrogenase [NADP(+)] GabD n=1 Tax=Corynebacterium occultum TaxID=2675219 RepID=A0A6B8VYW7_9CORY|nr:NAD-dependent succinate-semialdehyde dehydrogenase [Corynebacterium occultum]QGU08219.1 Succinate-semialdehyde dehydrogenase [NADP(+)] GabD [Corynebacterium occultum]